MSALGLPAPEWVSRWCIVYSSCGRSRRRSGGSGPSRASSFSSTFWWPPQSPARDKLAWMSWRSGRRRLGFFMGLLTKFLLPVIGIVLLVLVVGVVVLPFLGGAFYGIDCWQGRADAVARVVARWPVRGSHVAEAASGVPRGALVITCEHGAHLGSSDVLRGGHLGLGVGVTAAFGGLRREMPEKPVPPNPDRWSPSWLRPGQAAGQLPRRDKRPHRFRVWKSAPAASPVAVAAPVVPENPQSTPRPVSGSGWAPPFWMSCW